MDYNEQESIFQQCDADGEMPFAMIPNELIRNESISPNCRLLIIYLLSNAPGWKIYVNQMVDHFKSHLGRDKVYSVINEALGSGYLKRETYLESGKKRFKYIVSRTPKFKKEMLFPDFQYTERQDTENPDSKEDKPIRILKERCIVSTPPPVGEGRPVQPPEMHQILSESIKIKKTSTKGLLIEVSKGDFISKCVTSSGSWTIDEISVAWETFVAYTKPVTDWWQLLLGILKQKRQSSEVKEYKKTQEELCQKILNKKNKEEEKRKEEGEESRKQQSISNEQTSGKGTRGHFLQDWIQVKRTPQRS